MGLWLIKNKIHRPDEISATEISSLLNRRRIYKRAHLTGQVGQADTHGPGFALASFAAAGYTRTDRFKSGEAGRLGSEEAKRAEGSKLKAQR